MADLINFRADRKDFSFRQGQTVGPFTFFNFLDEDGNVITNITAARVTVREGTLATPGAAVSGFTVSPTITSGTAVNWGFTSTQTRLLTPKADYCYEFEVEIGGSAVRGITEGMMDVGGEIAS